MPAEQFCGTGAKGGGVLVGVIEDGDGVGVETCNVVSGVAVFVATGGTGVELHADMRTLRRLNSRIMVASR